MTLKKEFVEKFRVAQPGIEQCSELLYETEKSTLGSEVGTKLMISWLSRSRDEKTAGVGGQDE